MSSKARKNGRPRSIVRGRKLGEPRIFHSVFGMQVQDDNNIRLAPTRLGGGPIYEAAQCSGVVAGAGVVRSPGPGVDSRPISGVLRNPGVWRPSMRGVTWDRDVGVPGIRGVPEVAGGDD